MLTFLGNLCGRGRFESMQLGSELQLSTRRTTAAFLRMPGELRCGHLAAAKTPMAPGRCSLANLREKTHILSAEAGTFRQRIEVKAMRYGEELEAHLDQFVPEVRTHPHLPSPADLPKSADTAQRVLHDQAMMEYLIVSACDTFPQASSSALRRCGTTVCRYEAFL